MHSTFKAPTKLKRLPLFKRPFFAKKVLEVGGGHYPFAGVTHAVDKFPDANLERAHDMVLAKGAQFFEGDLEDLPFQASEGLFDYAYAYASHVLEHTATPERAIAELNRLTKRGYIETPSPLREQLIYPGEFSEDYYHKIFVWVEGDELNYIPICKDTLRTFAPADPYALIAKRLYDYQLNHKLSIETLLPRSAKYTFFYYQTPLRIRRHESFNEAIAAGNSPYKQTIEAIEKRMRLPNFLLSKRLRQLKKIWQSIHAL